MSTSTATATAPVSAPDYEVYGSLVVMKDDETETLLNSLSKEERVMAYYLARAAKPWNRIARFEAHSLVSRFLSLLTRLLRVYRHHQTEFAQNLKNYVVLFYGEHGPYSWTERTGMVIPKFSKEELNTELQKNFNLSLGEPFDYFWNADYKRTVDGNIEKSMGNYYGKGVTTEIYNASNLKEKKSISQYFELDEANELVATSFTDLHKKDLAISIEYLERALDQAMDYPDRFDQHMAKSLVFLIKYLKTGNEEFFKFHCQEWISTRSRIDYTMGWIEQYNDPMSIRGCGGAEVTVKTIDMTSFGKLTAHLEASLPYPEEYQRDSAGTETNPSTNRQVYGAGAYGPTCFIAAYCLPNYEDIRSNDGSKQIMYALNKKRLSKMMNPELSDKLKSEFSKKMSVKDPEEELAGDLWNIQCVLHETVGHGSGKLHEHTFVEGDNMTIAGKTYNIGDVIPVTSENIKELLTEDYDSLEELRAEINALHMSLCEYDTLKNTDLFKKGHWHETLGEDLFKECLFRSGAMGGITRLSRQPPNFNNVVGAHARADIVITSWLIERGCLSVHEENVGDHTLISCSVTAEMEGCMSDVSDLAELVMEIKATGDRVGCNELFRKYTPGSEDSVMDLADARRYRDHQDKARRALIGDVKGTTTKYLRQTLTGDDVTYSQYDSIIDQILEEVDSESTSFY